MPITKLHGWQVEYTNEREYHVLKQEIFSQDLYWFECDQPAPRILDVGAYIGLASLYFMTHFPTARITAFEPNPYAAEILNRNIWQNHLEDHITVEEVAIGPHADTVDLYLDTSDDQWWSTASFLPGAWTGDQVTFPIQVSMRPLTDWLTEPIDLLKLDIEGSEQAVLMATGTALTKIQTILIEFHPHPHQSLHAICRYLTSIGFAVSVWRKGKQVSLAAAGNALVIIRAERTDRA